MNANNIVYLKTQEKPEPLIDYFGSEKIPVNDLLSLIDLIKKAKENGNT
jgi:hypothetical protein